MATRIEYDSGTDKPSIHANPIKSAQTPIQALTKTLRRKQNPFAAAANIFITIVVPPVLAYFGVWTIIDLVVRCILAEVNRATNTTRLSNRVKAYGAKEDASQTIASVVGYREDPHGYQRALQSLAHSGAGIVIAGVDGDAEEDIAMLNVCRKVWTSSQIKIMQLPVSVGKTFLRDITNESSESTALSQAQTFLEDQLRLAGVDLGGDRSQLPRAIAFTQPHGDLKEIRLTSWTLALVLRKHFGFEFLWSTDSDTLVQPNTIANMSAILAAEPRAAGASAYVRLHNADETPVSRMTSLVFALDTYLNRAAAGALAKSEYLHGPATVFRLSALREVVVPWCRFHYFFDDKTQNCVLNEDVQYSMLLSQRGWQRLYVENASIMTGGPETLRQFLGQRLRWSRGIMLHRVLDAPYILGEGPITSWYMIRSAFYDVVVFAWIAYYALTGRTLFHVSLRDLLVLEILPPVYNYLRSFATMPETMHIPLLYPLYRITLPFIRTYTLITPLNTTWALPVGKQAGSQFKLMQLMRQEHEGIAFCAWIALLGVVVARVGVSVLPVAADISYMTIGPMALTGWTMAAYAMFVK